MVSAPRSIQKGLNFLNIFDVGHDDSGPLEQPSLTRSVRQPVLDCARFRFCAPGTKPHGSPSKVYVGLGCARKLELFGIVCVID